MCLLFSELRPQKLDAAKGTPFVRWLFVCSSVRPSESPSIEIAIKSPFPQFPLSTFFAAFLMTAWRSLPLSPTAIHKTITSRLGDFWLEVPLHTIRHVYRSRLFYANKPRGLYFHLPCILLSLREEWWLSIKKQMFVRSFPSVGRSDGGTTSNTFRLRPLE